MAALRGENKIAVVLSALPPGAADQVLQRLGPERGVRLRGLMEQVRIELSPTVINDVLREFEEALIEASRSMSNQRPRLAVSPADDANPLEAEVTAEPSAAAPTLYLPEESSSPPPRSGSGRPVETLSIDGAIAELKTIEPDRLAGALQGEHPRGVATVLSCLEADQAREVMLNLPPEVRKDVFPRLGQATGAAGDVSLRILRAVIAKSRTVTVESTGAAGNEKAQMMAAMLRAMERNDRIELMNALSEQDEALAAAVRELLYVFDDLAAIDGSAMQKLLAEIDAKTLAFALHGAPNFIAEKVTKNLSKRARESLTEEMSFLGEITEDQVAEARKSVVEIIQRMDESGDLG